MAAKKGREVEADIKQRYSGTLDAARAVFWREIAEWENLSEKRDTLEEHNPWLLEGGTPEGADEDEGAGVQKAHSGIIKRLEELKRELKSFVDLEAKTLERRIKTQSAAKNLIPVGAIIPLMVRLMGEAKRHMNERARGEFQEFYRNTLQRDLVEITSSTLADLMSGTEGGLLGLEEDGHKSARSAIQVLPPEGK